MSLSMGCHAKITAGFDKLQNKMVIREFDIKHNHRTGSDVVQHPLARRLSKAEQKEVEEVIGLKPKKMHMQDLISTK